MKSSTIRRSNLSKEKMAVLEALSKYNNLTGNNNSPADDYSAGSEIIEDGSPEVYVRPSKEKELDLLWKDFRIPKGERSPIVYLGIGFVAGIITTLVVSACIGMSSGNFNVGQKAESSVEIVSDSETDVPADSSASESVDVSSSVDTSDAAEAPSSAKRFSLFGSKVSKENSNTETQAAQSYKEYEVQNGDTMEKIAKSFYGTYSPDKVEAIVKANNMKDANKLSIGQKLLIPSDGIVENSAQ